MSTIRLIDPETATGKTKNYAARIRMGMAEAQNLQVDGTPTLLVGLTEPSTPRIKTVENVGSPA